MRLPSLILSLLLCASSMLAQDKVDAPSVAKRDQPIKINHPAGSSVQAIYARVEAGEVTWSYLPEDHFERSETYTVFAAPPGDYLITTGDSTILKIVDQIKPQPNPGPDPKPDPRPEPNPPGPEPAPVRDIAWAVWIYEQADSLKHKEQNDTRLSIETIKFLKSQGIKFASYDVDQDAAKAAPFKTHAGQIPALFLMNESDGFTVHKAPSSVEELKKIITEAASE